MFIVKYGSNQLAKNKMFKKTKKAEEKHGKKQVSKRKF